MHFWLIERRSWICDQEDEINWEKNVFDDNNQELKPWDCLGPTCSRSLVAFLSHFFVVLLNRFGFAFREFIFLKIFVWVGILRSATGYNLPSPDYKLVIFYTKSRLYIFGCTVQDSKTAIHLQFVEVGTFQLKFDKLSFFVINNPNHSMFLWKTKLKVSSLLHV